MVNLVYMGWGGVGVWLACLLLCNGHSGLRLDHETLTFSPFRNPRVLPLAGIAKVVMTDWSDGCDVVICLNDGEKISVADQDRPPSRIFERELRARDINVERR
ncbi:MAG: hypothetical protein AAGA74_15315 [Pseudomonadota bacterium]